MHLKTDFHLHAAEDKHDVISYTSKQLLDGLSSRGYHAAALTFHDHAYFTEDLQAYAKKKEITLIPGTERTIEGTHILILNAKEEELEGINSLEDLKKIKREDTLIMPSHPFYFFNALGKNLERNIHLFDAIEYCHFYLPFLNLNKKAVALSQQYNKPLVGNSDTHYLFQLGHTYSIVNADKNDARSLIKAIKEGRVEVKSTPLSLWNFLKISIALFLYMPFKIWKRRGHY